MGTGSKKASIRMLLERACREASRVDHGPAFPSSCCPAMKCKIRVRIDSVVHYLPDMPITQYDWAPPSGLCPCALSRLERVGSRHKLRLDLLQHPTRRAASQVTPLLAYNEALVDDFSFLVPGRRLFLAGERRWKLITRLKALKWWYVRTHMVTLKFVRCRIRRAKADSPRTNRLWKYRRIPSA